MKKQNTKKKVMGIFQIVLGSIGMLVVGALYLCVLVVSLFVEIKEGVSVFFLICFALSLLLIIWGSVRVKYSKRIDIKKAPRISTGNQQYDTIINSAGSHLNRLNILYSEINAPSIKKPLEEIINTCSNILDIVSKTPDKVRSVRELFSYYLPSTVKLLEDYRQMTGQKIKGQNIEHSISNIEGIMGKIVKTFNKSLDGLYQDKAIDIITDIEVMENMMDSNGFDKNKF